MPINIEKGKRELQMQASDAMYENKKNMRNRAMLFGLIATVAIVVGIHNEWNTAIIGALVFFDLLMLGNVLMANKESENYYRQKE